MVRRFTCSIGLWLLRAWSLCVPGRHRRNGLFREEGSAAIETALAASVLMAMMFGIIQYSFAHYVYHYVAYAAREGARFAIVRGSACSGLPNGCPASATDVQNYVKGLAFPDIYPGAMTVTTTWPNGGSICAPSSNPCNNPGNLVQVTVTYRLNLAVPFLSTRTPTVRASSEMVISQ